MPLVGHLFRMLPIHLPSLLYYLLNQIIKQLPSLQQNTCSFFFWSYAYDQILSKLQLLRKDYFIIVSEQNQFSHYIKQRMQKLYKQNPIIYSNLQLLKGTYRLQPFQNIPWVALGNELKLQQHTNADMSSNHQTFSEEISHNAFSKTKQLFKRKEVSSIIFDKLPNEDIAAILAQQNSPKNELLIENKLQFDSFGRKDCTVFDLLNSKDKNEEILSNDDLKTWNSQSLEINFNKVQEEQLQLPVDNLQKLKIQDQKFEQNSVSSIKEFCFNLNEVEIPILQKTPIKKWKDCKKNTERIFTQDQIEKTQNKNQLQSVLKQIINCVQNINCSDINNSLLVETKTLFTKFKKRQNKSIGKKLFTKENQQITVQESYQTFTAKNKKDVIISSQKTKRKLSKAALSCQKRKKIEFCEKKEVKNQSLIKQDPKLNLKQKAKQKRFRF